MTATENQLRPTMATTPTCQKKHARGTPTGKTPQQRTKQLLLRESETCTASRKLTYGGAETGSRSRCTVVDNWTMAEERALVQFVLLHGDGSSWISSKKVKFWESAAAFVHNMCGMKKRTSK